MREPEQAILTNLLSPYSASRGCWHPLACGHISLYSAFILPCSQCIFSSSVCLISLCLLKSIYESDYTELGSGTSPLNTQENVLSTVF